MSESDPLLAEVERCVRCGACLAHCPTYREEEREWAVARGRIALAEAHRRQQLPAARRLRRYLSTCLLCGSCTAGCPNEVDTSSIVRLARQQMIAEGSGGRFKAWLLRHILPAGKRLQRLFGLARLTRPLWARRLPRSSGLRLRVGTPAGGPARWLPELARPFLHRRRLPRTFGSGSPRVFVFPGCVSNYLNPEHTLSLLRLLAGAGADAVVPRGLGCCGLVALSAGENDTARRLARKNLDILWPKAGDRPDFITTPCGSCAYMLKVHFPGLLASDDERSERARQMSERVLPFSVLWQEKLFPSHHLNHSGQPKPPGTGPAPGSTGEVITWHDPCHLSRGLRVRKQPREILQSLKGARFQPMEEADICCGNGGLFSVLHPELSWKIARRKLKNVEETECSIVATECSGCWLQLGWMATQSERSIKVLSLPEVIERYRSGPEKK